MTGLVAGLLLESGASALAIIPNPTPPDVDPPRIDWTLELSNLHELLLKLKLLAAVPALSTDKVKTTVSGSLLVPFDLTGLQSGRLSASAIGDPFVKLALQSTITPFDGSHFSASAGPVLAGPLSHLRPGVGLSVGTTVSQLEFGFSTIYFPTADSDKRFKNDVDVTLLGGCTVRFGPVDPDQPAPDPGYSCGFSRYIVTVSGEAVPEPANWALMVGGFAAMGSVMRLRRRESAISTKPIFAV